MRVERIDHEHYTELRVYRLAHEPWAVYTVICKNMDYDHTTRTFKQPTARITPLPGAGITPDDLRRLAREYDYVADLAEELQLDKRAAFHSDDSPAPARPSGEATEDER